MTTDKGNKLIAEFMGIKTVIEECEFCGQNVNQVPLCKGDKQGNKRTHALVGILVDLKYDSSWDWLMPVVEKIEAIENSDDYEVDIFSNCCDIGGKIETTGQTKIEATYKAVIQFIQWYNQNTKP